MSLTPKWVDTENSEAGPRRGAPEGDMMPELKRTSTGYYHLRWNHNQWAQWPIDRLPMKDDCFNPDDTWPLVELWLEAHRKGGE